MYDGMINVCKEKGFTSHDVVAKLRGILHQKKIGHTGTLDPDATGVLPVCLGKGTKLCDMITDRDKTYRAVMLLGKTTDTQDISGQVLSEKEVTVSEGAVYDAAAEFVGDYMQVPPMYSAIKVDGRKLYELARAGQEIERKARHVVIHSIDITEVHLPYVTMDVCCSKGTYIRTLCQDIGEKLGCGACMTELTRLKVGSFDMSEAFTLSEIQAMAEIGEEEVRRHMVSVEDMLLDYPKFRTTDALSDKMLANGNWLPKEQVASFGNDGEAVLTDGLQVRMYSSTGDFTAIYQYAAGKNSLKNIKMFV